MWIRVLLLVALLARVGGAQSGVTVGGIVHDSITGTPLSGAVVQLVGSGEAAAFVRTVVSDSLGRFSIGDIESGRYMLGFFHPQVDSLGVELPPREILVDGRPVRVDLATPSPAHLKAAICGAESASDSGGVAVGFVRDARNRAPVGGSVVSAEWLELTVNRGGFTRRVPRLADTTAENGWFALCGVPSPATIVLVASHRADSTDVIEASVPAHGFLRRDLYIGTARAVVVADGFGRADSAEPVRRIRVGDGSLTGTVVAAGGGKALTGARVSIADGPETRADELGAWTLAGVPPGTRMLEVRAVGYYPERVAVDVLDGAPPIRSALSTMVAVLDTVRITASSVNAANVSGFAERRHTGMGRFLTREQIARRHPLNISDMFYMVPGMRLDRVGFDTRVTMRGSWGSCSPALYLDGQYMRGLTTDDIDSWINPDEVVGIEIYSAGMVPPQFEPGMSGCGSIVVWTGQWARAADPRPYRQRAFTLAGAIVLGLLVAATLK